MMIKNAQGKEEKKRTAEINQAVNSKLTSAPASRVRVEEVGIETVWFLDVD